VAKVATMPPPGRDAGGSVSGTPAIATIRKTRPSPVSTQNSPRQSSTRSSCA
jgi:hypothetical protein